jgi:hypothetical protein
MNLWERKEASPRAFIVYDVIGVEDLEAALQVLAGGQHDWRETAVVEVDPNNSCAIGNPQSGAIVDIVEYEPDAIKLRVQTDATGWLVLTDQQYPGWQATVDGQRTVIQTTNAAVRGLCVPAGNHDVTFAFRPILLPIGAAFSLFGILLLILAGTAQLNKRRGG